MVKADFSKSNHLFLSYPKGFSNDYESLVSFYDELIEIIPNDIHLFIITNTIKIKKTLQAKFRHKQNIDIVVINYWDEIWLRDCMGMFAENQFFKFNYSPNYCSLKNEVKYYKYINKYVKQIIAETASLPVIEIPLNIDGGNFVHNTKRAFMTEKVYEDNPGINVGQIISDYTGIEAIVVPQNPHDVIGHSDGYMAFKNEDTVFISEYQNQSFLKHDIAYINKLKSIAIKNSFNVLPLFDNPVNESINCACKNKKTRSCLYSARGLYINYIRFNNYVIMPEYTLPSNSDVEYNWVNKRWLNSQGFNVIGINCDQLAKFGGSLHCISFQY